MRFYRDAVITNMHALKKAFAKSVVIQYANFMPGEWLPDSDKSFLRNRLTKRLQDHGCWRRQVPDLLPFRRGQKQSQLSTDQSRRGFQFQQASQSVDVATTPMLVRNRQQAHDDRRTARVRQRSADGLIMCSAYRGAVLLITELIPVFE